jgi:hypothetical protein
LVVLEGWIATELLEGQLLQHGFQASTMAALKPKRALVEGEVEMRP